jgi:ankyrin repeat protein
MFAVYGGQLEITRVLLENGASNRLRTARGQTALDVAKEKGNAAMEALLGNATTQSK